MKNSLLSPSSIEYNWRIWAKSSNEEIFSYLSLPPLQATSKHLKSFEVKKHNKRLQTCLDSFKEIQTSLKNLTVSRTRFKSFQITSCHNTFQHLRSPLLCFFVSSGLLLGILFPFDNFLIFLRKKRNKTTPEENLR